jgi:hypothetical protein
MDYLSKEDEMALFIEDKEGKLLQEWHVGESLIKNAVDNAKGIQADEDELKYLYKTFEPNLPFYNWQKKVYTVKGETAQNLLLNLGVPIQ